MLCNSLILSITSSSDFLKILEVTCSSSFFFKCQKITKPSVQVFKAKNQNQKNFQFWVLKKFQTSVGFHDLAINWQFRVCPLTWFSNFLEHWLRVKPGYMILFYLWRIRIGSLIFEDSNSMVYIYPTLTCWPQVPKGGNQHVIWIYKEPLVPVS